MVPEVVVMDRGFESDAAYFDIVAAQSKNPADRRELEEVAKAYHALSKRTIARPVQTRREYWERRAEECRTLADQFRHPVCRAQLERLADAYEMMASHCDPVEQP